MKNRTDTNNTFSLCDFPTCCSLNLRTNCSNFEVSEPLAISVYKIEDI